MPWYGPLRRRDRVSSAREGRRLFVDHIQELELHVRDTKRGREEITREIPNVAESRWWTLDGARIVGSAPCEGGDILVGKITPKARRAVAGEKLLKAIFGRRRRREGPSLKVPPGWRRRHRGENFSRIEDQGRGEDRGERIGEVRRSSGRKADSGPCLSNGGAARHQKSA